MGFTCAALWLANDARADLTAIQAIALVDTDAQHLYIPEHIARWLQLKDSDFRAVVLADGHIRQVRYVSPVRIEMLGRVCITGALVLGAQVLLGAIPVAAMDLNVERSRARVSVNPNSPNIPRSQAKLTLCSLPD